MFLFLSSDHQHGGEYNGLNRQEAIEQIRTEQEYLDKVIAKHQEEEQEASQHDHEYEENDGKVISVLLADKSTHHMPVQPLIMYCETAKRQFHNKDRFGSTNTTMPAAREVKEVKGEGSPIMEISLIEFDSAAVISFMDVLLSLHRNQQQKKESGTRKRRMDEVDDTNKYIISLIHEGKISDNHIVECVKLSHYLQCLVILDALTSILQLSIDSRNCMALCSLSDALNLKSLFEASVNYVIERLDAFQGTGTVSLDSYEEGDVKDTADGQYDTIEETFASLPYELRSRVLTMRNVMRSSVIGRGSKVSGLFFSSGTEFLAIFRETIRDQKERLKDATDRRDEVIRERTEEWVYMCERRGTWFDRSLTARNEFIYGADVKYGLEKIEKQRQRLKTLQSFYDEQKTIFKGGGFASEIRL